MPAMTHISETDLKKTMDQLALGALLPTKTWFYRQEGRVCGPLSASGFAALVRMGYVKSEAMVWQEGEPERSLSKLPDMMALSACPFAGMPELVKPIVTPAPVEPEISFDNPPSFVSHFAALMVDSFLIGGMSIGLSLLVVPFLFGSGLGNSLWALFGCWFATASLYFALSESGAHGATLGKRLMGLRVVSEAKKPVGLLRGLWRGVVKTASVVVLPIAGVVVLNSKDKRAVHDMLAQTRVVKR